jgi:hypothetical protein
VILRQPYPAGHNAEAETATTPNQGRSLESAAPHFEAKLTSALTILLCGNFLIPHYHRSLQLLRRSHQPLRRSPQRFRGYRVEGLTPFFEEPERFAAEITGWMSGRC